MFQHFNQTVIRRCLYLVQVAISKTPATTDNEQQSAFSLQTHPSRIEQQLRRTVPAPCHTDDVAPTATIPSKGSGCWTMSDFESCFFDTFLTFFQFLRPRVPSQDTQTRSSLVRCMLLVQSACARFSPAVCDVSWHPES